MKKSLLFLLLFIHLESFSSDEASTICNRVTQRSGHTKPKPVAANPFQQYPPEAVQLLEKIGEGKIGEVFSGTLKTSDGHPHHVVFKKLKDPSNKDLQPSLFAEYEAFEALGEKVGFVTLNGETYVILPLIGKGKGNPTLFDHINSPTREKGIPAAKKLSQLLLESVIELEKKGVIHCDLKFENALMVDNRIRLIDYGFSKVTGKPNRFAGMILGTPKYMGLEAYEAKDFTPERMADALAVMIRGIYLNSLNPKKNIKGKTTPTKPGESRVIDENVIEKGTEGKSYYTFRRVIDDKPELIPPQLDLILASRLAKSPSELAKLMEFAKKEPKQFLEEYPKLWETAFWKEGFLKRELLAEALLSSSVFSGEVFAKLGRETQKELIAKANQWKGLATDYRSPPTSDLQIMDLVGRYHHLGPQLDAFLKHPAVADWK